MVFLDINGVLLDASATDRLCEITLAVAEGRMDKPELAATFRGLAWGASAGG